MLLAEKGGVCRMIGVHCCTFIPNKTSPDGTVTRALAGLTALSEEWAENSGVNTSVTGWLDSMFGKWKNVIITVLWAAFTCMSVLMLCGCCLIPCARGFNHQDSREIDDATNGEVRTDSELRPVGQQIHASKPSR